MISGSEKKEESAMRGLVTVVLVVFVSLLVVGLALPAV
jgi:hypothetical protein